MDSLVRLGGLAVLALVALWVILEVVAIVFGIVTWMLQMIVGVLVLGILLYVAYLLLSSVLN
ncbi:hypothetical protein [Natronobiforma cellulositropha]|uniref:hypothetical protein n=1 Tax=Natronobiforma cellulositropha TaxID=1679076 RepID=UPI0021D5C986|nr:hypothetical protein [Natronobiforma cellulositropha]